MLVNILDIDPTIVVEMPYATESNFTGEQLYDMNVCLLRPKIAEAIAAAQKEALQMGYGLKLLDCYRPKSVSMKMWKIGEKHNADCKAMGKECLKKDCDPATPTCLWEPLSDYLSRTSKHGTGAAVDITLLENGKEIDMGSTYDFFGPEAWFKNASGESREHRYTLKNLLDRHGFNNYFREWWHYNHSTWKNYQRIDISFKEALGIEE